MSPGLAPIIRSVDALLRFLRLDQHIDPIRIRRRDRQVCLATQSRRQAVGELHPLIATVGGLETLPITLRSRCALVRFSPDAESTTAQALLEGGLDARDAELAAALGGGSVDSARAWAEEHLDEAREIRDAILAAEKSSATQVLDFAESFRGGAAARERAERFLAVHAALSRSEVARAATDGDARLLERWLDRADAGERARRELARRNLNPQMLVESLLLS